MTRLSRRELFERSLFAAAAAAAAKYAPAPAGAAEPGTKSPNETLNLAVVGVKGRGGNHVEEYCRMKDVQITTLVDCDEGVIGGAMKHVEDKTGKKPQYVKDIRKMLEDKSIDAVSIATCNHTHALFAIWAMQAGKHVYVEKPCCHNPFEGRKAVEASRKYKRICQVGTQSRSSKGTKDLIAFLHAGKLGKIKIARGLCYKRRTSIGKTPDGQPPASVDYDLWLGPAPVRPFSRNRFHYNWHWFWDYGNGDIGNQGVHEMDRARWGLNKNTHPTRVIAAGGRFGYEDDGETANTQICWYDFGDCELIFEVRGLETDKYMGAGVGVLFHCENGYVCNPSYSGGAAFDKDGKKIQDFGGGGDHFRNFLDAVRSGRSSDLAADIEEGHLSAALCHLGNISYRLGELRPITKEKPFGSVESANEVVGRMKEHLAANKVALESTQLRVGPLLAFDPKTEKFTGNEAANKMLTRDYRKPFVVPEKV